MSETSGFSGFEGKVALVTGAGSGIGKSLASSLLQSGATVYALDCNAESLGQSDVVSNMHCVALDVTDACAFQKLVDRVIQDHGRIDYLFNNAGVTLLCEASDISYGSWKNLLDVNVMGVCNGIAAVYPQMVKQGFGHILNTSSLASATGYATAVPYTCSKAFVTGLTRSLTAEAKLHNVNVSLVCPGYVKTNIFSDERIVGADKATVFRKMPFKFITPEKAAQCILGGALRKRKKIIFPLSSKLLWLLANWMPFVLTPFQTGFLKPFRNKG